MTVRRAWLLAAALALAACPPRPPETAASVKAEDLPKDSLSLNAWADEQMRKQTAQATIDALAALDKAIATRKGYESLWRAARASAWLGDEYEGDHARVEDWATRGTAYADEAVRLDPKRVEGHYYRGITLGQFVQAKTTKASQIVPEVLAAAKRAVEIDEKFDHAGPLRLLGSLYAQAPEPPVSVGDHEEGIKVLDRANQHDGTFPQNQLLLGEAYRVDKQLDNAERAYGRVLSAESSPDWSHWLPKWQQKAQKGLKKIENLRRQKSSGRDAPF